MSHFAFSLSPNAEGIYDLHLDRTNNLAVVKDGEAVGQHGRQRLMTYYSEWFLNTTVGVHWLDEIMGKNYDPALSEAIVKDELMGTPGVTSIETFSVSYTRSRRELVMNEIYVLTEYNTTVQL